jgi:hypothetical protein
MYLRTKYGFPRFFGDRVRLALPKGCSYDEVVEDIRACRDFKVVRPRLQSLLHTRWPRPVLPSPHPGPPLPPPDPPDPPPSSPLLSPLLSPPPFSSISHPSSPAPLSPPSSPLDPSVAISLVPVYNAKDCDSLCPLLECKREFLTGDKRKQLVKHVNEAHRLDPTDPRVRVWLEASNRFVCPSCHLTATRRQKHVCAESVAPAPVPRGRLREDPVVACSPPVVLSPLSAPVEELGSPAAL